jgi:hypothetical protein
MLRGMSRNKIALAAAVDFWDRRGGIQPLNSFCAAMERRLPKNIGGLSKGVRPYLAWSTFKGCMANAKMGERAAELEAWRFLSGTDSKVKDRY